MVTTNNAINTPYQATKGDLLVGTGPNSSTLPFQKPQILPVGPDGYLLSSDSTQTTGVKWVPGGSGAEVSSFLAYSAGNSAPFTGNGRANTIFLNTDFNIGGNYSTATGFYTCPFTGLYYFFCSLLPYQIGSASGSSQGNELLIFNETKALDYDFAKNSMTINRNLSYCNQGASGSCVMQCNAGDVIRNVFGWFGFSNNCVGWQGIKTSTNIRQTFFGGSFLG